MKRAATIDSARYQVSLHYEIYALIGCHLVSLVGGPWQSMLIFILHSNILVGLDHLMKHEAYCIRGKDFL